MFLSAFLRKLQIDERIYLSQTIGSLSNLLSERIMNVILNIFGHTSVEKSEHSQNLRF